MERIAIKSYAAIALTFLFLTVSVIPTFHGHLVNNDQKIYDYFRLKTSWFIDERTENQPSEQFDENPNAIAILNEKIVTTTDRPMNSSWPMQSHDVKHTGRSQYSTADNQGAEIWRVRGDETGAVESSAVIDNTSIIYFGTMGADGSLYALYPNGTLKWKFIIDGVIWSTPAIADDGTIYVATWGGNYGGYLYAIYPNGTMKWVFWHVDSIGCSPSIGSDGTIYFGTMAGYFFAINPNGTEQWRLYLGGSLISSPAIGLDNIIYVGTTSHYLYAVNPNGTIRWQFGAGQFKGNPSIADDGTIYAPSFDGYLYALNPNGTMRWRETTGPSVAGAGVALADDGTIYIGTELLRAYSPNGTLKWSSDVKGDIYGTVPAVSVDGTIYVSAGGSLVAINSDGIEKWRKRLTTAQIHSSPSIGPNDRIYVGSQDYGVMVYGYLHAFGLGPLRADAGGPYSGLASHTPAQFYGIAFGGQPPYTYFWEFGDGNTSDELEPSHLYRDIGTYNVTFTLTDNEGNTSNDTATATITYGPPTVWYIKPEQALYIGNIRICKFPNTLILGKITVQADASHPLLDIDRIEFYLDFELQAVDDTVPYTWTWDQRYPFSAEHTHRIIIKAITTEGTEKTLGKEVHKYF